LLATAIATIQNGTFIKRAPAFFDVFLLAGLVALSWLFTRLKPQAVVAVAALTLLLYLLFCITVFGVSLIWFPLLMPAGGLIFAVLFRLVAAGPREQAKPSPIL
jgi:hypothetical protein